MSLPLRLVLVLALLAPFAVRAQKTDTIHLFNGDRVVGDIKDLKLGLLRGLLILHVGQIILLLGSRILLGIAVLLMVAHGTGCTDDRCRGQRCAAGVA